MQNNLIPAARHCLGVSRIDLLVSLIVIGAVLSISIPSLTKQREDSKVLQSQMNLLMLSASHFMYATDHNGNQWTETPHDLAEYGNHLAGALAKYAQTHPESESFSYGMFGLDLGWACTPADGCQHWILQGTNVAMPIAFGSPPPQEKGFGYSRLLFAKSFNQYVGGKVYDPVFFAPADVLGLKHAGDCLDDPGEFCFSEPFMLVPPTYSLSAAALHDPTMWSVRDGAFPNEAAIFQEWDTAFQIPTFSQILYPDLKTHMMEHHWLQNNPRPICLDDAPLPFLITCQPQYFNHSINSEPVTLFYDGSIRLLPNSEVQTHEKRTQLWRRDTAFGENGYFLEYAVDDIVDLSHHVLTSGGAFGRDTLGPIADR